MIYYAIGRKKNGSWQYLNDWEIDSSNGNFILFWENHFNKNVISHENIDKLREQIFAFPFKLKNKIREEDGQVALIEYDPVTIIVEDID